jgi:hypothetical protein
LPQSKVGPQHRMSFSGLPQARRRIKALGLDITSARSSFHYWQRLCGWSAETGFCLTNSNVDCFRANICREMPMTRVSDSSTLLRASFKIKMNGQPVIIATVGQAYRFITSLSPVEWMEYRSLHAEAKAALEAAAENGMLNIQATQALRTLFARAGLL